MKTDKNETGDFCPLLKKTCIERKCKFYTKIIGKDPQSEETFDHWDCSWTWLPILLIENAQTNRQTGAAVESLRNRLVDHTETIKTIAGSKNNGTLHLKQRDS